MSQDGWEEEFRKTLIWEEQSLISDITRLLHYPEPYHRGTAAGSLVGSVIYQWKYRSNRSLYLKVLRLIDHALKTDPSHIARNEMVDAVKLLILSIESEIPKTNNQKPIGKLMKLCVTPL